MRIASIQPKNVNSRFFLQSCNLRRKVFRIYPELQRNRNFHRELAKYTRIVQVFARYSPKSVYTDISLRHLTERSLSLE